VQRKRNISGLNSERGVVILLVAIVMLFVVGAMAVLAIDFVTFYTARSEAQLAADGAALAAARVLANSGMTSDLVSDPNHDTLVSSAQLLAATIARQVARQNQVGGRKLNAGDIIDVDFPNFGSSSFDTNPHVFVRVTRSDLPTFFARIWGSRQVAVSASATAEAYNPAAAAALTPPTAPIAPTCVKPWLLPNKADPADDTKEIFDQSTGAIKDWTLLGQAIGSSFGTGGLKATCTDCTVLPQTATAWKYFPAALPPPLPLPSQVPACATGFTLPYQLSIAGCVQQPIACGLASSVDLDTSFVNATPDQIAADAVNCLTHAQANQGDRFDPSWLSGEPFRFLSGNDNPVVRAGGSNILTSDSMVTIPVVDVSTGQNFTTSSVKVIGFVQMFLNFDGTAAPGTGIPAKVINMAGCGTGATGQAILGSGTPVPVRLISP
jgi:hypothetical protein